MTPRQAKQGQKRTLTCGLGAGAGTRTRNLLLQDSGQPSTECWRVLSLSSPRRRARPIPMGRAANRSSSAPKGTVKRRHARSARRDRQIARRSGRLGAPRHAGSRACGVAAPHGRWSVPAVRCSTGHRAGRGGGRRPTRRPGRAGPGRCRGCGPRRVGTQSGCAHPVPPVGSARPGVRPARPG